MDYEKRILIPILLFIGIVVASLLYPDLLIKRVSLWDDKEDRDKFEELSNAYSASLTAALDNSDSTRCDVSPEQEIFYRRAGNGNISYGATESGGIKHWAKTFIYAENQCHVAYATIKLDPSECEHYFSCSEADIYFDGCNMDPLWKNCLLYIANELRLSGQDNSEICSKLEGDYACDKKLQYWPESKIERLKILQRDTP